MIKPSTRSLFKQTIQASFRDNESLATTLPTLIDSTSTEFIQRSIAMHQVQAELKRQLAIIHLGGGLKAREKVKQAPNNKLLVRERIIKLLDPFSPFMELSAFAAHQMYEAPLPAAGIITGIGRIAGYISFSLSFRLSIPP
jgi:3-methylcrotonyl-CoA carboxylase beta subunit